MRSLLTASPLLGTMLLPVASPQSPDSSFTPLEHVPPSQFPRLSQPVSISQYCQGSWSLEIAGLAGTLYGSVPPLGSVLEVNRTTGVVGSISVGYPVTSVTYDSWTGLLYVATSQVGKDLAVVSPITGAVKTYISTNLSFPIIAMTFDTVTGDIYAADGLDNEVFVVNGTTNVVSSVINVGLFPVAIAFDSIDHDIYVANQQSGNISVIDGSTAKYLTGVALPKGSTPCGLAVDATNGNIYVSESGIDALGVISDSNRTLVTQIHVGSKPSGVAYDPVTHLVLVADFGSNEVSIVDPSTYAILETDTVGTGPVAVSPSLDSNDVYVFNSYSFNISVISGASQRQVATISLALPFNVSVRPSHVALVDSASATFTINLTCNYGPVSCVAGTATFYWYLSNDSFGNLSTAIMYDPTIEFTAGDMQGNVTLFGAVDISVRPAIGSANITILPIRANETGFLGLPGIDGYLVVGGLLIVSLLVATILVLKRGKSNPRTGNPGSPAESRRPRTTSVGGEK